MSQAKDEEAKLLYLDWQDLYNTEKPFQIFSSLPDHALPNARTSNLVFKEGDTEVIYDARGMESAFRLDKHGFAFRCHRTQMKNFEDAEAMESLYLPELEALIRSEVESVDQVYFFDWRAGWPMLWIEHVLWSDWLTDKKKQGNYWQNGDWC